MAEVLSLSELESYDAGAPNRGTNRRFLCPACGDAKPRDAAHRSLCVNTETGLWVCKRCNRKGKLTEFWECRTCGQRTFDGKRWTCACKGQSGRQAQAQQTYQAFQRQPAEMTGNDVKKEPADLWNRWWQASGPLAGTAGARYLHKRAIPSELAAAAGVRFATNWYGWTSKPGAAVLFPIRDEAGQLVAVDSRFTDSERKLAAGGKSRGVFATPGALKAPVLAVTEAPIDALSLAAAGVPAIALCGVSWPAWLVKAAAKQPCIIALDADTPGDEAADRLRAELERYSAVTFRLRPKAAKDWNEALVKCGLPALQKALRGFSCELVLTDGLDEIDARSAEATRLAQAGRLDAAAFVVQLLPLEWRSATERYIGVSRQGVG